MATKITSCPIWGAEYEAEGFFDEATRTHHVDDSPRAGGGFIISQVEQRAGLPHFDNAGKARLNTWLIDQRLQGIEKPTVTTDVLDYVKNKPVLPVHERAYRLLRFIAGQTPVVGQRFSFRANTHKAYEVLAWSESTELGEIAYFLNFLKLVGWLETRVSADNFIFESLVTVNGYNRLAENNSDVALSQAFVAMWFGSQTDEVYTQGIAPAIREAGYDPVRIDQKLDVEKIDDAIIAEIRRSRFLVADFTHGDKGVRGGVYFEAGFAMGLNIPVFFTCRSDMVEELHFDTRQYAHIVWSTPEQLKFELRDRILARIGHGPNSDKTALLTERPHRQPLGQWLVDNVPRGTNLEPPSREGSGRPNTFLDEESR